MADPQHGKVLIDSAGGFIYTPDQYFSGTDSFQYQANDGLADGNVATVTINVHHVSQAPVGTSGTAGITPGTPYVVQAADFGFTDPHDSPPDAFAAVEITTLPTTGSLTLSGAVVVAGQFVSVADLTAGKLMFTLPPGPPGSSDPRLTFKYRTATARRTAERSSILIRKRFSFHDIPVVRDSSYTVNETNARIKPLLPPT